MKNILCVGSLIMDVINEKVNRLPNEGESIDAPVTLNLGGNAYSVSVNLARLNSGGYSVYCHGTVGADHSGDMFESSLKKEGVHHFLKRSLQMKTSCNIILQEIGKGSRFIFNQGANVDFSANDFISVFNRVQPDIVCFGELPSINFVGDRFLEAVDACKKTKDFLIYLDPLVNSEEDYGWMTKDWSRVDILHCNRGEGAHITKKDLPSDMVQWFMDRGVKAVVVSDGANGCYFGLGRSIRHIPAFPVREVDPTGAGDAMTAGIISRVAELLNEKKNDIREMPLEYWREILRYASASGAVAVGEIGCIGLISREHVEKIMNT